MQHGGFHTENTFYHYESVRHPENAFCHYESVRLPQYFNLILQKLFAIPSKAKKFSNLKNFVT